MADKVCTLPFPRLAAAVPERPSPAPGANEASSLPLAPAASAAHAPSDGGCSQTPHVWHQDRCPGSTVCQSGPCPAKKGRQWISLERHRQPCLSCRENKISVGAKRSFPSVKPYTCHTLSLSISSLTKLALMSRWRSSMNNKCTSLFSPVATIHHRRYVSSLDTPDKGSGLYPSNYIGVNLTVTFKLTKVHFCFVFEPNMPCSVT